VYQNKINTLTLDPGEGYMHPIFWDNLSLLLNGITAFQVSEEKLHAIFRGRSTDLWEMAGILGDLGPEYILIVTVSRGIYLYDCLNNKRWIVPNYPAKAIDPTGAKDGFAGGFLAGYRQNYDPLEATLLGNIAASLVVEGSGVFYALNAMPGLKEARLKSLRELVNLV